MREQRALSSEHERSMKDECTPNTAAVRRAGDLDEQTCFGQHGATRVQTHLVGTWPTVSWNACNYYYVCYGAMQHVKMSPHSC